MEWSQDFGKRWIARSASHKMPLDWFCKHFAKQAREMWQILENYRKQNSQAHSIRNEGGMIVIDAVAKSV